MHRPTKAVPSVGCCEGRATEGILATESPQRPPGSLGKQKGRGRRQEEEGAATVGACTAGLCVLGFSQLQVEDILEKNPVTAQACETPLVVTIAVGPPRNTKTAVPTAFPSRTRYSESPRRGLRCAGASVQVLHRPCTCSQEAPEHRQIPEALQMAAREWARGEGIQEPRGAQSWRNPRRLSSTVWTFSSGVPRPRAPGRAELRSPIPHSGWTRSRLLAHKQNTREVILPCWRL